jgi:hypothetical protein
MKNIKLFIFASIMLLIYALLIVSVSSCKPSKVTTIVSEKIRIDTIRDYKVITKFNAIHDTLLIDNPCDSAGILTTFYSRIILPQGKIIIRSYKGKIQTTVNIDSIKSVYEKKYRYKETSDVKASTKIVTKTIYPTWLIVSFIFETLVILGYIYFRIFYPTNNGKGFKRYSI